MRLAPRLVFAVSLGSAFLSAWIVLPAPSRPFLILAVAATELSAWLVLIGLLLCAVTRVAIRRSRYTRATVALAGVVIVLASVPLVQLPFALRQFDRRMLTTLGDDFLRDLPANRLTQMRVRPVSLVDLFHGIDEGEARVTRRILFAEPHGVKLTLDVYRPATAGPHPSIVQIYGGAWQRGTPAENPAFATYFATRGHVVFAIDYRHAPRWQWPTQLDDVHAALDWIRRHADEYEADVSRLALFGRSAGAQLAMLAAYDSRVPPVQAVVSYYGPVDLADAYRNPPCPDPLDVRSIEEALLGGTFDSVPERYLAASPITYVSRRLPPTLLIYGGRDHVIEPRYGVKLDDRLRASGSRSVLLEIPWAEHAFDAVPHGPSGQLALYYTEQFLAWALSASADRRP